MASAARFASQSALIYGMRLAGAALTFLVQAAMARMWGAELLGKYLVLIAALNLVAMTMPLGFQVIGSYFAAEYRAAQNARMIRVFAWRSYLHIAIMFGAAFILGAVFQTRLTEFFQLPSSVLLPGLVMAAATAIVFVNGALLAGVKYPVAGFLADALLKPIVMLSGFIVASTLVGSDDRLVSLVWTAAGTYLIVALLHMRFAMKALARTDDENSNLDAETQRWWRFALPWVVISIATEFFFDIDLLLLSKSLNLEDLAVFGVCVRIFALIAFAVTVVYTIAMPDILEAHKADDRHRFHRKTADANLVAGGLAAVAGFAMLFSAPVLSLFGTQFATGAKPLAILCVGLAVRSVIGPTALVLSLHDRPYASLPPIAVGMIVLILANHVLVPPFGITGAAYAASLAITVWSLIQWLVARKQTGTDVSIWPRLRVMFVRPRLHRG